MDRAHLRIVRPPLTIAQPDYAVRALLVRDGFVERHGSTITTPRTLAEIAPARVSILTRVARWVRGEG